MRVAALDTGTCLRVAQVARHTPDTLCTLHMPQIHTHTTHTHSSYTPFSTVLPRSEAHAWTEIPLACTGLPTPLQTCCAYSSIPHTALQHTNVPTGMCPSHACTPCTCISVPTHVYTHPLGEPRPHTRYPRTFPTALTGKPPCAHSPAPFTSLLHWSLTSKAQFGLVCACTSHGDTDTQPTPWAPTAHTGCCHTSPHSCTSITHLGSPPVCCPRGCFTMGLVGCYGVLIAQSPPPVQPHCPGLSHGLAKSLHTLALVRAKGPTEGWEAHPCWGHTSHW